MSSWSARDTNSDDENAAAPYSYASSRRTSTSPASTVSSKILGNLARRRSDTTAATIASAQFPDISESAIDRYADFNEAIMQAYNAANRDGSMALDEYMARVGIKFVPYLGEFVNGDIEAALGVMTSALLEALRGSVPEDEDNEALVAFRDQLVVAAEKASMWASNPATSEQQFSAMEPILDKAYGNRPEVSMAAAKSILTGMSSSTTGKAMVQALASNESFIRFALYYALDEQTDDGVDLNIAPVNWATARRGHVLPLTMLRKNDTAFPMKVDGRAGSSLFAFSIALALYIGVATFKTPEDRTPELMHTIEKQRQEISRLQSTPEQAEADKRRVVGEQLDENEAMLKCWIWGFFTGACNSRVPPPAGFLESIEEGSVQYGFASDPIVSNPLTDILTHAAQDTNTRITNFMAEYNGVQGLPAWRALVLGIGSANEVIMRDYRAVQRDAYDSELRDFFEGMAAGANGYTVDGDGDVWARRTMVVVIPLSSDEAVQGAPVFRAQLGSLCIIAALGRTLNCVAHPDLLMDSSETTETIKDAAEPDTLRLLRTILGLSMVSPDVSAPFQTDDGLRVGFRYVLSLPVLVDNGFVERLKAFVRLAVERFMHIGGDCEVVDIDPGQTSLSFAPSYTTCVGRNLMPELTRALVSVVEGDNPLAGTADNRGDIEDTLIHMIELAQDQTSEVMAALGDAGKQVFTDRLLLNAGPGFRDAMYATDTGVRDIALATLLRISMQQPANTDPVRPPIQPFAPLAYAPADELNAAAPEQWASNSSLPFIQSADDDQRIQTHF